MKYKYLELQYFSESPAPPPSFCSIWCKCASCRLIERVNGLNNTKTSCNQSETIVSCSWGTTTIVKIAWTRNNRETVIQVENAGVVPGASGWWADELQNSWFRSDLSKYRHHHVKDRSECFTLRCAPCTARDDEPCVQRYFLPNSRIVPTTKSQD